MSLAQLDERTRALVALAVAVASGREALVEACCRDCLVSLVPGLWVEELLLQSVLMVGWPRALIALAIWRRVGPALASEAEQGSDYSQVARWQDRGEAVCREVYGSNYAKLRANVLALHPSLEAWMITEGYGKVLGRPGLDLARRELCVAVQVAFQGAERQLHSHLRGALNAGAGSQAVSEALEIARPHLGPGEAGLVQDLWARIRP